MSYKQVKGLQFISPYIFQVNIDCEKVILGFKQHMVNDLLENFPSMDYRSITFELCKPNSHELRIWVEDFKCLDGRYHYGGDFVSREWLEKELSQKPYKITMCADVWEEEQKE